MKKPRSECTCKCHQKAWAMHFVPCCYPDGKESNDDAIRSEQESNTEEEGTGD